MNSPCHPVALIVGENVPNLKNVGVHDNNSTQAEENQNEVLHDYQVLDTSTTIHECSVDNLNKVSTTNINILEDDKIKGTLVNAPCHPVALIVREYVPNYTNNVEVNDDNNETLAENDNEILHDYVSEPTAASVNIKNCKKIDVP